MLMLEFSPLFFEHAMKYCKTEKLFLAIFHWIKCEIYKFWEPAEIDSDFRRNRRRSCAEQVCPFYFIERKTFGSQESHFLRSLNENTIFHHLQLSGPEHEHIKEEVFVHFDSLIGCFSEWKQIDKVMNGTSYLYCNWIACMLLTDKKLSCGFLFLYVDPKKNIISEYCIRP